MRGFLQVLQVSVEQLLFLLHDAVNLLVEGQKLLGVDDLLAARRAVTSGETPRHTLAVIGACAQSIFEIVPILFLLLFEFLFLAQLRVILLLRRLRRHYIIPL